MNHTYTKKKPGTATVITALLALIIFATVLSSCHGGGASSLDTAVKTIQNNPTDIMLWGDDFTLPEGLEYRKLEKLDEESLAKKDSYKYSFLIINDLEGSVTLSEDEIELVRAHIYDNQNTLIYFGDKYLTTWQSPSMSELTVDGNRAVEYRFEGDKAVSVIGIWGAEETEDYKKYPNMLGDVIVYEIEECISANEKTSSTEK